MAGRLRFIGNHIVLSVLLATWLLLQGSSSGAQLSSDGGYDLVIAVDDAVTNVDPVQQQRYVQNVKNALQALSIQLWRTTRRKFYVNSVELVVPDTWDADVASDTAVIGNLGNADIRIRSQIASVFPSAINPNLCGLPGDFIQLPFNFFENANANEFGPIWKTLLALFARYRYGVWEEHGFVGEERFPYFVQNEASASWEVTGCNDQPLAGKFVNVTTGDNCEITWTTPQEVVDTCRFVPDRVANTAQTSLMHFHWVESVVDFCDDNNHNSLAVNKQNAFCNHKSVMQVIRESPDYAVANTSRNDIPALNFRAVKSSSRPLLYILIDKGELQTRHELAVQVPPALINLLTRLAAQNVIGAVGSYPNPEDSVAEVREEVGWSNVRTNFEQFVMAVGEVRLDGNRQRDFSKAILEVTGKIKAANNPFGGVILIVKYGADFASPISVPESELILALNEQKIILHSLELPIEGTEPRAHLGPVASATTGGYSVLTTTGEAQTAINNVLNYVFRTATDGSYITNQQTKKIVAKQEISPSVAVPGILFTPQPWIANAEAFYSSPHLLTAANFIVASDGVAASSFGFRRTVDWNRDDGVNSYRINVPITSATQNATVVLNCGNLACEGTLFGSIAVDSLASDQPNDVKIEVATSTDNVDLNQQTPLTINAKATINGIPVRNLFAEALISNASSTNILTLRDDGNIPDTLENDGTFSGFFVPETDGAYQLSVRFSKLLAARQKRQVALKDSSFVRLLPIDQGEDGTCSAGSCEFEDTYNGFTQIEQVRTPVVFSNANAYQTRPAKITTLFVRSRVLIWAAPRIAARGFNVENVAAQRYEIRHCASVADLLNNFEGCEEISANVPVPGRPGTGESLPLPLFTTTRYLGIKSEYNGVKSDVSNLVIAVGTTIPTLAPTTQGPTSEPPSTTSDPSQGTTSDITTVAPPESSTAPSDPSTAPPTTTTTTGTTPPTTSPTAVPPPGTGGATSFSCISTPLLTLVSIVALLWVK